MRLPLWVRSVIAVAALSLIAGVSACSASPAAPTLRVLAGEATVDGQPVTSERAVRDGELVEVGGEEAVVEIQWTDGSFTRLASLTRFRVGGDGVRGELETGTAWNAIGPDATGYAVGSPDGRVSAATGATFAIRCLDVCDGVVATGSISLDSDVKVVAPKTFRVDGSESAPAAWDVVYTDAFALANSQRDTAAGFAPPADEWRSLDPALGSLSGKFTGPTTVTEQSCTGWSEQCARVESTIFATSGDSTFPFTFQCDGTLPCRNAIVTTITFDSGGSEEREYPLVFDGDKYSFSANLGDGYYCVLPDGSTQGRWSNTFSGSITPSAAEVRDGVLVVTAVTISNSSALTFVEGTTDPTCKQFEYEWVDGGTGEFSLVGAGTAADVIPVAFDSPHTLRPAAGPARPSVLSGLRTPLEAIPTLEQGSIIGATIVVLVLLLAFPGYLLTLVIEDHFKRAAKRRAIKNGTRAPRVFRRLVSLAIGLTVASVVTAAIDPNFGRGLVTAASDPGTLPQALTAFLTDPVTWRLLATAFVTLAVFVALGVIVVKVSSRRLAKGTVAGLHFRWWSLVILLAGVVASRLLDINPGIIFGLVAALAIAETATVAQSGRLLFVSAVFSIAVGVGAWAAFAALEPIAAADPQSLLLVTATELASALTITAVSTLPLALLPVASLDGGTVRKWSFWAWALVYASSLALFLIVLVDVPASWVEIQGDVLRWMIGFAAFTVVLIAIWAVHAARSRARAADTPVGTGSPE